MVAGLPRSAWTVNNTFENHQHKVLGTLELSEAVTMPAAAICTSWSWWREACSAAASRALHAFEQEGRKADEARSESSHVRAATDGDSKTDSAQKYDLKSCCRWMASDRLCHLLVRLFLLCCSLPWLAGRVTQITLLLSKSGTQLASEWRVITHYRTSSTQNLIHRAEGVHVDAKGGKDGEHISGRWKNIRGKRS